VQGLAERDSEPEDDGEEDEAGTAPDGEADAAAAPLAASDRGGRTERLRQGR
jgi:hypothetical protein